MNTNLSSRQFGSSAIIPILDNKQIPLIIMWCDNNLIIYDIIVLSDPSRRALELAKYNVIKYYAVVGMLEQYRQFIFTLQTILPKYFAGIYREMEKTGTFLLYVY